MGIIGEAAHVADRAARDVTRVARTAYYMDQGRQRAQMRRAQAEQAMGAARNGTLAVPVGTVARPSAGTVARQAQPIDGAWLLNLTDAWIGQHCYLTEAARHTLALWTTATHFRLPCESRQMIWDKFAHPLFVAVRPGSGKTTAMKVGGYLCAPFFFGIDNNPTAPGLCMTISQEHAVVCIDEAHRLIGPKGTRKADVVTIMCASFEQEGTYLNGRGGKANRVPVYSPMMIAGKADPLLTSAGEEIADVIDRSVLILMDKPPAGVELKPVTRETRAAGAQIATRAAQWAGQQMADPDKLSAATATARETATAIGLTGRAADVWLAMFTVAALASPGHLDAACEAALELRLNRPVTREEEADPLKDLEADLLEAGAFTSWGASTYDGEPEDTEEAEGDDLFTGIGEDEDDYPR
jgi:hypothetical protein